MMASTCTHTYDGINMYMHIWWQQLDFPDIHQWLVSMYQWLVSMYLWLVSMYTKARHVCMETWHAWKHDTCAWKHDTCAFKYDTHTLKHDTCTLETIFYSIFASAGILGRLRLAKGHGAQGTKGWQLRASICRPAVTDDNMSRKGRSNALLYRIPCMHALCKGE